MYEAIRDPYCYVGTSVLKNRWKIRDQSALAEVEAMFTQQRIAELYHGSHISGRFTLTHLCKIHHYLFQDVYSWAGKIRTIRIAKEQSVFAYPECIRQEGQRIFGRLQDENFLRDLSNIEDFIDRAA